MWKKMSIVTETNLPLKVFKKGKVIKKVPQAQLVDVLLEEVEKYIK